MRDLINLVNEASLEEKYTNQNTWLLQYMRDKKFDPYNGWYWVCEWIENNGLLDDLSELLGHEVEDSSALMDEDPEIFYKLPKDVQARCAEDVVNSLIQSAPAEAPTWAYLDLTNNKRLLKRQTWLVHFSDEAREIAFNGFIKGVENMDSLGLTTYLGDGEKRYPGYNFAFEATSRDANITASTGKYGRHAVMFQNSGVKAYHYGDEEYQVMFWGQDVSPHDIVLLVYDHGDWGVAALGQIRGDREYAFKGTFEQAVAWVIKNFAQYRRVLTGR